MKYQNIDVQRIEMDLQEDQVHWSSTGEINSAGKIIKIVRQIARGSLNMVMQPIMLSGVERNRVNAKFMTPQ
jgi:hypothetical protein